MKKIQLKRGVVARIGAGALLASALATGCSSTHGTNKASGGTGPDGAMAGDGGVLADGSADGGAPPPLPSACARVGDEIKITSSAGSDTFAIVWDRNHYVVAYSDKATGNGDIYAISLDATGHPMGSPVAVMQTPDTSDLPSMVTVPSGYVIAWQEGPMFKGVFARALDGNLKGIGDGGMVAYTQSTESRPVMSRAPGGVAIAWMDEIAQVKTIEAAILDPMTLKPVTGPKSILGNAHDVAFPWLAGDANSVALLWSDKTMTGTYDVHFADVDATLATHNDVPVRTGQPGDALLGRMIPTSFGFFSAWEDMRADDNQIFMALVDPMGSHMADGLVEEPNSGDANWPNMAWTGSSAGVVYYQWRGSTPQIFMSFVDGHGKRVGGLHDVQVSSTSTTARFPDVVWTGTEFGVAWVDTRDNTPQVYFARVACKQ